MRINLIGLIVFSLVSLGCTRSGQDHTTLKFNFAQKSGLAALGANPPEIVILNVSGGGIARPIVFQCENKNGYSTCPSDGNLVLENVPKGTDRLVQVLLVYKDATTGGMIFFYDDVTKTLSLASESVTVSPQKIGSSALEGQVSGRYLDSSGLSGPTGILEASFVPPNGRPPMLVMQGAMIAGWFNIFLLDQVDFNYTVNGQPLFTKVRLSSPEFAGSAHVARFNVPSHYRAWTDSGNTNYELQGASIAVIGYFGPGVSGQLACYDNSTRGSVIPDLYSTSGTLGQNPLTWMGSDSSNTNTVYRIAGGADETNSSCANPDLEFTEAVNFYWDQLRNGKDSILGIRPPFRYLSMGDYGMNFIDSTFTSNTLDLNWIYLPGTTGGAVGIQGADIYMTSTRPSNPDGLYGDGGIKCGLLSQFGFELKASVPIDSSTPDLGHASINNVTGSELFVICPYTLVNGVKKVLDMGLPFESHMSGGIVNPIVTGLRIQGPEYNGSANWSDNTCVPLEIAALNGTYSSTFVPDTIFNLSVSGASGAFYTEDSCANPISGGYTLPYYTNVLRLFFKGSGTNASTSVAITAVSTAPDLSTASQTYNVTLRPLPSPLPTTYKLYVRTQPSTFAYQCNSVSMEAWYLVGTTPFFIAPPVGSGPLWPTLAGLQFYPESDWNCQGTTSDYPYFYSNSSIHRARFKYVGTSTSISIAPSLIAGGMFDSLLGDTNISISQPGAISRLAIMMPNSLEEGQCTQVGIELQDSMGHVSPASGNGVSLNLLGDGGDFYSDSTCNGTAMNAATIGGNQAQIVLYYKHLVANSSPTVMVTAATPALSGSVNVIITPPTANKLVVLAPGQTFSSGVISGTPANQPMNTYFQVQVLAINYKNEIDTAFGGSFSTNPDGTGYRQVGNFMNGVATFSSSIGFIGYYNFSVSASTQYGFMIHGDTSVYITP